MFIVFEGLDGSGKSTLIQYLSAELARQSRSFLLTREPGGTELGDSIRELLLKTEGDPPTPEAELLLYEAGRAQHVNLKILPALKSGQWVLCDRYQASSLAFQVGGRGLDEMKVEWLNQFATGGLEPDLTVLLDLSVEESERRRKLREVQLNCEADRFEREAQAFHNRVRQYYLKLAKSDPSWLVLNAESSIEQLQRELMDAMRGRGWLN